MSVEDLMPTFELLEKMKAASILSSACELELFDKLSSTGPCSAEKLAEKYSWNGDCLRRLLDCLVSLDYVTKTSDPDSPASPESPAVLYSNTSRSQFLVRSNETTIWGFAKMSKMMAVGLGNLAKEVQTASHKDDAVPNHVVIPDPEEAKGQGHGHGHGHSHSHGHGPGHGHGHGHGHSVEDSKEALVERYRMYDGMGKLFAPDVVTHFDLSQHKTTVDLGGGSGLMSYALARAYPHMDITVFDLPHIAKMAKEKFLPPDLTNVHFMGGDFLETDLPQADLYFLSKIVHDWRADQVDTLMAKIYEKVNPGGGIILVEKCLNDEKNGPYPAHCWDVLVMAHCGGQLRSGREYEGLLQKHGFSSVSIHRTDPLCSCDVIYARKEK